MGSRRLKRKMGLIIGGHPLIDWVLLRVKKIKKNCIIYLATSNAAENNYLINRAKKFNINYFRGSENDVLSRFFDISKLVNSDAIVRICADNPFIDPDEIDTLIQFYLKNDYDYCFNHQNKINSGHADGFGAEIFSKDVLAMLNKLVFKKQHKEHVTKYIWDNPKKFKIGYSPCSNKINFPQFKFDIDTYNDKIKIDKIIENGITIDTKASQIIDVYNKIIKYNN